MNGVCVREIEVVEAERSGFVDVCGPSLRRCLLRRRSRDFSGNDRRIVGAGDGDGERVLLSGAAFSVVDGDDVGEGDGFTVGEEVELEIALEGPIARVVDVEEVEGRELGRQQEERSDCRCGRGIRSLRGGNQRCVCP